MAGLRSFRDAERHDIEAELTGWPPGPGFVPRGKADQAGVRALDIALLGIPRLINMIGNIGAPSGQLVGEPGSPGKSQEPENEVDDFPVMWAAEGTVARTLPWQLDPARQPKRYRTELVLTDQRLLILGVDASAGLAPAQELWQVPRSSVAAIERLAYPQNGSHVRVRFTDGSWTRWKVGDAGKLASRFLGERKRVAEEALTPQQRERVAELLADPPLMVARSVGRILPVTEPPTLELLPDGTVAVELRVPLSNGTDQTLTRYLSPSGTDVLPKDATK
ncbi:hypothetical protein [Streptomyces sp. NPDC048277]|uniref:hypothetical protein n=1 Tax=Streptomyces sp. NPDC048277 TaxID=3155027 RepID=UPI0033C49663